MPKIEKWRVEELSLLLGFIASLLELGRDLEWAGVFSHYDQESRLILGATIINDDALRGLVRNIKHCFATSNTLACLVLRERSGPGTAVLNLEFGQARARLWQAVEEIEALMTEWVN
jgi:hypothetical protein